MRIRKIGVLSSVWCRFSSLRVHKSVTKPSKLRHSAGVFVRPTLLVLRYAGKQRTNRAYRGVEEALGGKIEAQERASNLQIDVLPVCFLRSEKLLAV
jgi:hypothetical protein